MLKELLILDLILIREANITFSPGFTTVTGETGAGKTALFHAFSLLTGARADTSLIRKGSDSAVIEALFEPTNPYINDLLIEHGFPPIDQDPLIIKRILSRSGKNRIFINDRTCSLPFLTTLSSHLFELVSQHAQNTLRHPSAPLNLLDQFANSQEKKLSFTLAYEEEKQISAEITKLKQIANPSEKLAHFQNSLDEILEIDPQENEENTLYETMSTLHSTRESGEKLTQIITTLSDNDHALCSQLSSITKILTSLAKENTTCQGPLDLLSSADNQIREALFLLEQNLSSLDFDPELLETTEERLSAIHQLLRKHGPTFDQLLTKKNDLETQIEQLISLEETLVTLEEKLSYAQAITHTKAKELSEHRKQHLTKLSERLTLEMKKLNLPDAQINLELTPKERSQDGDDHITLLFSANTGQTPVELRSRASGGELSRFLLCTKLLFHSAEKTLFFDEVDANIGGETATCIGNLLQELGKTTQLIAITHFPQMAAKADHHLAVSKIQQDDHTISTIQSLSDPEKKKELLRMRGGEEIDTLLFSETP